MVVLSSWVPGITSLIVILLFITMSSLWCLMMSVVINMSNEYNYKRIIYEKDNKIGEMGKYINNLNNTLRAKRDFIDRLNSNNITNKLKKNLNIESTHEPVSPRNVNVGDGPMNGDPIDKNHPLYEAEMKLWYGDDYISGIDPFDNKSEKL